MPVLGLFQIAFCLTLKLGGLGSFYGEIKLTEFDLHVNA